MTHSKYLKVESSGGDNVVHISVVKNSPLIDIKEGSLKQIFTFEAHITDGDMGKNYPEIVLWHEEVVILFKALEEYFNQKFVDAL